MLRWALKLQEYQYRVEYIKGEKNGADALSRYCIAPVVNVIESQKGIEELVREYHIRAGHGSAEIMLKSLEEKYSFENMQSLVKGKGWLFNMRKSRV